MFKSLKLKQMAVVAHQMINSDKEVFDTYNAAVQINAKSNHYAVREVENAERLVAFGFNGSCSENLETGRKTLKELNSVTIYVGSVYKIAKATKRDPMRLIVEAVSGLIKDVRSREFPKDRVSCFHRIKKEEAVQ